MEPAWEIVAQGPAPDDKGHLFEELLDKLRSMYEEARAQDVPLELRAMNVFGHKAHAVNNELLSVPRESAVMCNHTLSISGVAKVERPLTPKTPTSKTPRIETTFAVDVAPRSTNHVDPRVTQSLDNLAFQQERLNAKLTEMFTSDRRATSRIASIRSLGRLPTTRSENNRSSRASEVTEEDPRRSRFAVSKGDTAGSSIYADFDMKTRSSMERFCPMLRGLFHSPKFAIMILFVILSYTLFVAIETELISEDPDIDSTGFQTVHYIYNAIFFAELLLRCLAYGRKTFVGVEGLWNGFDAILVFSAFVEIVMEIATSGSGSAHQAGAVARIVRIARVIRTVRLLRTFRQFHEFRKMAYALLSSLRTLVCSLAILIFVMFVFAVGLTRSAADVEMRSQISDLDLRFGNLRSTTYTLFLSVSNGISWDYAYMPLWEMSWWAGAAFILYISITMFGVLNVVTSIFVESVIRSVQHYKDLIVQDKEVEKQIAINHVKEVFYHVDSDGSGEVTIDELEYFLTEPSLRKYMEALDIDAEDTRMLFRLLDRDGSRVISLEEFCEGCLRLKGSARSIDVQTLMFQIRSFLSKWSEFTSFVESSFAQIRNMLPQEYDECGSLRSSTKESPLIDPSS